MPNELMPRVVMPRVLMIDNVDSFTFMLVDYLRVAGAEVTVARNDAVSVDQAVGHDAVVISPGPGAPADAGQSVAIAAACVAAHVPLLGICLGHQALALACGSTVERCPPIHGKVASVSHDASGLFAGLPSPFNATRYHSLSVPDPHPPLVANGWSMEGTVMAMRHVEAPAHGLQFHPESVASQHGRAMIAAFLGEVAAKA